MTKIEKGQTFVGLDTIFVFGRCAKAAPFDFRNGLTPCDFFLGDRIYTIFLLGVQMNFVMRQPCDMSIRGVAQPDMGWVEMKSDDALVVLIQWNIKELFEVVVELDA